MHLPEPRGPLSAGVLDALAGAPYDVDELVHLARDRSDDADLLCDGDLHLALWSLYELHYRGFDGVDPALEWEPDLIRVRRELEGRLETELRHRATPYVQQTLAADGDLATRLFALADGFEGPSVARYLHREAHREQLLEFMVQRSIYHLKESDPASFVIPRIEGRPKAALVELQYDEYGGGRPERVHATMFGDALEGCGLRREYGAYLDAVPGYTLASHNVMSLFGLNRRLQGAALGHLGAFEATSSLPCRKIAGGIRRLGLPEVVAAYFDEHVEADAVHEQLAFRAICAGMVESGQAEEADVVLGAVACLLMDALVGRLQLEAWEVGRSTLRRAVLSDVSPASSSVLPAGAVAAAVADAGVAS